jgi:hypothetical protein
MEVCTRVGNDLCAEEVFNQQLMYKKSIIRGFVHAAVNDVQQSFERK